jgi:hypothetical protein
MSILSQPASVLSVARKNGLQVVPEFLRVIFFSDMDKFMDEDVIDDGQGGHDNSPAKR